MSLFCVIGNRKTKTRSTDEQKEIFVATFRNVIDQGNSIPKALIAEAWRSGLDGKTEQQIRTMCSNDGAPNNEQKHQGKLDIKT